jgi:hypothetical protein
MESATRSWFDLHNHLYAIWLEGQMADASWHYVFGLLKQFHPFGYGEGRTSASIPGLLFDMYEAIREQEDDVFAVCQKCEMPFVLKDDGKFYCECGELGHFMDQYSGKNKEQK